MLPKNTKRTPPAPRRWRKSNWLVTRFTIFRGLETRGEERDGVRKKGDLLYISINIVEFYKVQM